MFDDIEQTATFLRDAITEIPKRYNYDLTEVKQLDKETQDLLHLMELSNFNAFEGYKASKELQTVRRTRRDCKDEYELLEPLIEVMKQMQPHVKQLNRIIGEIRKLKHKQESRKYRTRVRFDLQDKFKELTKKREEIS